MQIDLTKLAGQASTRDGLQLYPQAIVIALLFVRDFAEGQQKGKHFQCYLRFARSGMTGGNLTSSAGST
jgi:hypothetical protein